jgi:hypothetical protein
MSRIKALYVRAFVLLATLLAMALASGASDTFPGG